MNKREAMRRIRTIEPLLRAEGAQSLYLFGSTARNRAGPSSDVDILIETGPRKRLSLLALARLTRLTSEALHAPVDLIPRNAMKPHILRRIEPMLKKVF